MKVVTDDLPINAIANATVTPCGNPDCSLDAGQRLDHFTDQHGGHLIASQVPVNFTIPHNVIVHDQDDTLIGVGVFGRIGREPEGLN